MAIIIPKIKELYPSNLIIMHQKGVSLQGYSDGLDLKTEVKAPSGAQLPIQGIGVLTLINSNQHQLTDRTSETHLNFLQNTMKQTISLTFKIKNIHPLADTPVPLILTVCIYDQASGEDFKTCHSGHFSVMKVPLQFTFGYLNN